MRWTCFGLLAPLIVSVSLAAPTQRRNSEDSTESTESEIKARQTSQFPFNKIVAFGDDFTDDGSGSYAHGITGNPKTGAGKHMWGANTFTDGLIAVSYLSKQINIPISYNYAWGSAGGAGVIGSVCSNGLLNKGKTDGHAKYQGKVVPAALDQVNNYTQSGIFNNDIKNTLHFFWTGNNDMIASLGWLGRFTICVLDLLCIPGQKTFRDKLLGCFQTSLTKLIDAGAQHILVPNVYPRQLSPWTGLWITQGLGMITNFGAVVDDFNTQLAGMVDDLNAQYGSNIMVYDVNSFIKTTLNDPSQVQGASFTNTCVDGCKIKNPTGIGNWKLWWNTTIVHKKPSPFYWMTEIMPSSTVHKQIASDMKSFLTAQRW